MSEKKRPTHRILYKSKETGVKAEIGVLWPNDFGGFNLQIHTEERKDDYGVRLPFADCLKLAADNKGFINVWPIKARGDSDDGL